MVDYVIKHNMRQSSVKHSQIIIESHLEQSWSIIPPMQMSFILVELQLYNVITPYIRMLDSDWLIAVIFFTNSGLALRICRIFASCRCTFCICITFNFFSWYLQNRICRFYPSPRRL
jgi:hypothetical protein